MKKRKNTTAFILFLAALFLLLGFSSCSAPEPDPPLTDEEALRGQWAVYADVGASNGTGTSDEPGATGETELEFVCIIDIEYTLPGYWLMGMSFETEPPDLSESEPTPQGSMRSAMQTEPPDLSESEPIDPYKITEITGGLFIKSNRTQSKEDGSFTVSGENLTVEYKFIDAERNTMEAKVTENTGSGDVSQLVGTENSEVEVCIMKRLIDHEIKVNMDLLSIGK